MRLSEKMILGSTLKRHTHQVSVRGNEEGCALQLAGVLDEQGHWVSYEVMQQFANRPSSVCPVCNYTGSFFNVIANHLNDCHQWSIDAIAEWVDQFEPVEIVKQEPCPDNTTVDQVEV